METAYHYFRNYKFRTFHEVLKKISITVVIRLPNYVKIPSIPMKISFKLAKICMFFFSSGAQGMGGGDGENQRG